VKKTNAVRILDRLKMDYQLLEYEPDEADLSASNAAVQLGVPVEQIFKTLVARGEKTGVLIVSIPGGSELNLKALAKISSNKKVEMVPLKEVQQLTGYIRGAVSPLGIKSSYPYYLDQSAFNFPAVIVSGGTRGLQVRISPLDLSSALGAVSGKVVL